jgi:hypothetical protein
LDLDFIEEQLESQSELMVVLSHVLEVLSAPKKAPAPNLLIRTNNVAVITKHCKMWVAWLQGIMEG